MKKNIFLIMITLSVLLVSIIPVNAKSSSQLINSETETISLSTLALQAEDICNYYSKGDVEKAVESFYKTGVKTAVLKDITLPTSLGIETIKIDVSKIDNSKLIIEYEQKDDFVSQLSNHGVDEKVINTLTYSQYKKMESEWFIDSELIPTIKEMYPELKAVDISNWTYGMYTAYRRNTKSNSSVYFTDEQVLELNKRGIQLDDAVYLLKDYHNAELLLSKSDELLKLLIEERYQFNLAMVSLQKSDLLDNYEIKAGPTYQLPASKQGLYTWQYFPGYMNDNGDWFLNSACTSEYWLSIQSNRARRTQAILYNTQISTTRLACTNLYGTYSQSSLGAHEGIDFAPFNTIVPIYSVTWGNCVKRSNTNFSVYDPDMITSDCPSGKTYIYYHLNYISDSQPLNNRVGTYDYIGDQGYYQGYHLHFAVNSGNNSIVQPNGNDVLTSISPYQLVRYIGEGDPL